MIGWIFLRWLKSWYVAIVFILEVLKRLNVRIIYDTLAPLEDNSLEEDAAILREQRTSMSAPDAQFFT